MSGVTGYIGWNCATNIDNCNPNLCQNNGTCADLAIANYFTCHCLTGYTKTMQITCTTCTINIDECSPNPCKNNGTCTDLIDDFVCECGAAFTFENCAVDINEYDPNPCLNNASCIDIININNYTHVHVCVCARVCVAGYDGRNYFTIIDSCGSSLYCNIEL